MIKDICNVLITKEQIALRVKELGKEISNDYFGKTPLMVCILRGASIFFADLIREITLDIEIDFMAISSYGAALKSSGEVRMIKDLNGSIEGKDVIIVEDIVDSGFTVKYLKNVLFQRKPNSIKVCALLDKPERREVDVTADYIGMLAPNEFVVGYGLDYKEKFRNLTDICLLLPSDYNL